MKLLEAANVNPPGGSRAPLDGRWSQGYNASSRSCSMQIEVEDPCGGEANTALVGDINDRKGRYWVQPVSVRNFLRQSTKCEQPDDKDWFRQAVAAKLEYVAGGYLVKEYMPAVATWIGDTGVPSVSLAGTSAAQYRTAVVAAYDLCAKIFFSGEVIVRISDIDDEGGPLYAARLNNVTISANMQLAVDVAPCSIVRVGP